MGYPTTVVDTTQIAPDLVSEKLHDHLTKSESDALTASDLVVRSPDGTVNKFGAVTIPQTGTIAVTFDTAFVAVAAGELPVVTATPKATIAGFDILITNVTLTGFEIGFNADPGAPVAASWHASL